MSQNLVIVNVKELEHFSDLQITENDLQASQAFGEFFQVDMRFFVNIKENESTRSIMVLICLF